MPKCRKKAVLESVLKLDKAYRLDMNKVKLSIANTLRHELAKCEVAYHLLADGHVFATEARLKTGERLDVFDLCCDTAWEIETKSTKSTVKKKKAYPVRYVFIINPIKDIKKQM